MQRLLLSLSLVLLLAGCGDNSKPDNTPPVASNPCKGLAQAACETKASECHWKADDAKCGQGAASDSKSGDVPKTP